MIFHRRKALVKFFYRQKQAIKSRHLARDHGFHVKFLLTLPAKVSAPTTAYWCANNIAEQAGASSVACSCTNQQTADSSTQPSTFYS